MACKKSELISAINSYASARVANDGNLVQFAGDLLSSLVETLDFQPEEEGSNDDQPE